MKAANIECSLSRGIFMKAANIERDSNITVIKV
jgi:hypothetical protein